MKAILVNDQTLDLTQAATQAAGSSVTVSNRAYPYIRLYADSSIGRDVAPLFIPDIPVPWISRVCIAVRISRLGKNISEKFAIRYVDAISMVNVISPDTSIAEGMKFDQTGGVTVLDSAITTGRWLQCNVGAISELNVNVCGKEATFDSTDLCISRHISQVSSLATLKTGDIIIIEPTAINVLLVADTYINASIGTEECLRIKVK